MILSPPPTLTMGGMAPLPPPPPPPFRHPRRAESLPDTLTSGRTDLLPETLTIIIKGRDYNSEVDNDNDNMFYFLLIYISRKLISICQDIYFPTDQQEKGASEAQLINDAPFFTITISYINRRDIFTFQYLIAYSVFGCIIHDHAHQSSPWAIIADTSNYKGCHRCLPVSLLSSLFFR